MKWTVWNLSSCEDEKFCTFLHDISLYSLFLFPVNTLIFTLILHYAFQEDWEDSIYSSVRMSFNLVVVIGCLSSVLTIRNYKTHLISFPRWTVILMTIFACLDGILNTLEFCLGIVHFSMLPIREKEWYSTLQQFGLPFMFIVDLSSASLGLYIVALSYDVYSPDTIPLVIEITINAIEVVMFSNTTLYATSLYLDSVYSHYSSTIASAISTYISQVSFLDSEISGTSTRNRPDIYDEEWIKQRIFYR